MSSATYVTYKGILFSTLGYTEDHLSYVENEFQMLDDDVVTVTYQKSGTIWMLEILGLIWNDGDPSWVRSAFPMERAPWIEFSYGLKFILKYAPPRRLTSHLPIHLFPKSFLHSKAKVIYVLRNPKDVLISLYYYCYFFNGYKDPETMEAFLEEFLCGNVPYGSWFEHVKGWMEMKDKPNFFFITYEELQEDLRGSVKRICQFLGKELNSQQIDAVVENASFQKMKENRMSNMSLRPDHLFNHKKGKFLRKGICGDWKNHLTVAQSERFDHIYQEKMQGVNVIFPWD